MSEMGGATPAHWPVSDRQGQSATGSSGGGVWPRGLFGVYKGRPEPSLSITQSLLFPAACALSHTHTQLCYSLHFRHSVFSQFLSTYSKSSCSHYSDRWKDTSSTTSPTSTISITITKPWPQPLPPPPPGWIPLRSATKSSTWTIPSPCPATKTVPAHHHNCLLHQLQKPLVIWTFLLPIFWRIWKLKLYSFIYRISKQFGCWIFGRRFFRGHEQQSARSRAGCPSLQNCFQPGTIGPSGEGIPPGELRLSSETLRIGCPARPTRVDHQSLVPEPTHEGQTPAHVPRLARRRPHVRCLPSPSRRISLPAAVARQSGRLLRTPSFGCRTDRHEPLLSLRSYATPPSSAHSADSVRLPIVPTLRQLSTPPARLPIQQRKQRSGQRPSLPQDAVDSARPSIASSDFSVGSDQQPDTIPGFPALQQRPAGQQQLLLRSLWPLGSFRQLTNHATCHSDITAGQPASSLPAVQIARLARRESLNSLFLSAVYLPPVHHFNVISSPPPIPIYLSCLSSAKKKQVPQFYLNTLFECFLQFPSLFFVNSSFSMSTYLPTIQKYIRMCKITFFRYWFIALRRNISQIV